MKKKFLKWGSILLGMSMAFTIALVGCGEKTDPPEGEKPGIQKPGNENNNNNNNNEGEFKVTYRTDYTPERFADVTNTVEELAPGVHLVTNTMTLKKGGMDGKKSIVYAIEVDLKKADVRAGTKGNQTTGYDWSHGTPYQMALDWEKATGGKVYASINADFFNQYDAHGLCVNAFVKDGIILKAAHNDMGGYDYKVTDHDVPASAPMLFGVKGTTAQIAPITTVAGDVTSPEVKKQLVQSKLYYALADGSGNTFQVQENISITNGLADGIIAFRTSTQSVEQKMGGYLVKVDTTGGLTNLKVLEVIKVTKRTEVAGGDGYGYLLTTSGTNAAAVFLSKLKAGDTLSFSVASPDGKWNDYDTILGCRQALVMNNQIAATITKENTNGAQQQDVPRTAVGIKNGKVVLFGVESMYYYAKSKDPNDPHGMNLPELAEFAYYYGCSDAANFDGGGSTHLVVHPENADARLVIRSADYAPTTELFTTRPVCNAFLITSRVGK